MGDLSETLCRTVEGSVEVFPKLFVMLYFFLNLFSDWDHLDGVSEISFESEEDDRDIIFPANPPIYEGAPITVNDSMTAILSYLGMKSVVNSC